MPTGRAITGYQKRGIMSHLWIQCNGADLADHEMGHGWAVLPLSGEAGETIDLSCQPPARTMRGAERELLDPGVILIKSQLDERQNWVLMADSQHAVRVNGGLLSGGLRVRTHKDEIQLSDRSLFFSSERLVEIAPFPGSDHPVYCPRCQQVLEKGQASVRCPGCGLYYHQTSETPCWTYSESCAHCPQPTDLEAGFRWIPEEF